MTTNRPTEYTKAPDDILDYGTNWGSWLEEGETLTTGTTAYTSTGLTLDSVTYGFDIIKAWVSGGVSGARYDIVFRAVTTEGRQKDVLVFIKVEGLDVDE